MTEPVNLNRFRKDKARADKRARADQNAVKSGRTRGQKQLDQARRNKAAHDIDQKKRDP